MEACSNPEDKIFLQSYSRYNCVIYGHHNWVLIKISPFTEAVHEIMSCRS